MNEKVFRRAIQSRTARVSVGASSARGRGTAVRADSRFFRQNYRDVSHS